MSFLKLIIKNLLRHKTRTILTILGISIGITTIVTLGVISSGLSDMLGKALKIGGTDITVAKAGSADIVLSFIDEEKEKDIQGIEGVEEVSGFLMVIASVNSNPYFMIGGIEGQNVKNAGMTITEGRVFKDNTNEIILGKIAASVLDKNIGDELEINQNKYQIVGLYESGISFQDGGAAGCLETWQKDQNIEGKVSMFLVKVAQNQNIEEVAQQIEVNSKGDLVAIKDLDDFDSLDQGMKIVDSATWAISLLAIIIGGIGVMNTIIMSVFERTREIGILRALGWKRNRVLKLILGESIAIGIISVVVGGIFGIIITELIMLVPIVKSYLAITYTPEIFIKAIVVALAVVLVGGLYPAYKASRLSPLEALRYE